MPHLCPWYVWGRGSPILREPHFQLFSAYIGILGFIRLSSSLPFYFPPSFLFWTERLHVPGQGYFCLSLYVYLSLLYFFGKRNLQPRSDLKLGSWISRTPFALESVVLLHAAWPLPIHMHGICWPPSSAVYSSVFPLLSSSSRRGRNEMRLHIFFFIGLCCFEAFGIFFARTIKKSLTIYFKILQRIYSFSN